MKRYITLMLFLVTLQSCFRQSCQCHIDYAWFNNDSVFISSANYSDATAYQLAHDSLQRIYPQAAPLDSVQSIYIGESYGNNVAQNNEMKKLASEGYTCICAK